MGEIRHLTARDIPAVAELFLRTFRRARPRVSSKLSAYLLRHYLEAPGNDPEIRSLVHIGDDGALSGFIGVTALPMSLNGQPLRAAVCGALMAAGPKKDPLVGARLVKAALAGPQDLTASDTANHTSVALWQRSGGLALPGYSLEWLRFIRPATGAVDLASTRFSALRWARPLARVADGLLCRPKVYERWSTPALDQTSPRAGRARRIDAAALGECFRRFTAHAPLRPDFSAAQLTRQLDEAAGLAYRGEAHFLEISRANRPIGAAFVHLKPAGLARVLQIVASPGAAAAVFDALTGYCVAAGASAMAGRTQPFLFEAMLSRRIAFASLSSTVVHSRRPEVIEAFRSGEAFFNGLAGETWGRLVDDAFA